MKKGTFIKSITFLLFFILLILLYLWAYIFPSVKTVNMLKREIREYSLKIKNAKIEKNIFIKSDEREGLLFAECDSAFVKVLDTWKNDKYTFETALKYSGDKAGVSRLKISSVPGRNILTADSSDYVISQNKLDMDFIAGLRYGAEFIRVLPLSGQYLLIKSIHAERRGAYYNFIVIADHLTAEKSLMGVEKPEGNSNGSLIDMNSHLLKRPVYLSPLKIRKISRGSGK